MTLLADYMHTRSAAAFAELMERYFDLVYSTALRRMREPADAQDVAQIVFIDLARMATRLPADVQLGGWLHRHTCFVASNRLRASRRRKHHELEKARMIEQQSAGGEQYEPVAPLLDEAIDELAEPDRTAIVLRFFERREFASIGAALGASEDAARMRVNRAVEKLRGLLVRRGVTIPAAVLAVMMTQRAVSAAPAHVSTTAAEVVMRNMNMSSGVMSKMFGAKVAAAAGVVVVAGIAAIIASRANGAAATPVAAAPATTTAAATTPASAFKVTVTGTKGVTFKGLIIADGKRQIVNGTIPHRFVVSAQKLSITLQKTAAEGEICIELARGRERFGSANSAEEFAGVLAKIVCDSAGVVQEEMFTTVTTEEADDAMKGK